MTKTFLDSGVLLTAWKGKEELAALALGIMEDEGREFCTSQMVRLELIPKPAYFKQREELQFYCAFFETAKAEEGWSAELGDKAMSLATAHGLSAADALNVAAAIRLGAGEFITSEAEGKPIFRVKEIKVLSLLKTGRKA